MDLGNVQGVDDTFRSQGYGMFSYGGDESLFVRFYYDAVQLKKESERAGRPIYKKVPWIEIRAPGDRDVFTDMLKFVDEQNESQGFDKKGYTRRFPKQWQAFQMQSEVSDVGTPIESWPNPQIDVAKVAELKALHVFTVEQLASVSDAGLQKIGMGARGLQEQAKAWLEAAKDSAKLNQLAAENKRLQDQIDSLKLQFRELAGEEPRELPEKKRRGRPKGSKNKKKLQEEAPEGTIE